MASVEKLWASGKTGEQGAGPDDKVVGHIAHWRDSDGKSREKTFRMGKVHGRGTQTKAERYGEGQEVDRERGEDVRRTNLTIGEFLWENLDERRADLSPLSIVAYKTRINGFHRHPTFTGRGVRASVPHVKGLVKWLATPERDGGRGLAARSVQQDLKYLRGVYRAAARARYITYPELGDVCAVKAARPEKAIRWPLTWVQVRALADAMPPHMRAMVLFQAGTGLRIGELRGLRVQDITWPLGGERTGRQGWVRIDEQMPVTTRAEMTMSAHRKSVKSDEGHRSIPLGPRVAGVLREHMNNYAPVEMDNGDRVIFDWYGYDDTIGKAADRVGADDPQWPTKRDGKRITSHALRHHYVSALDDERVPFGKIAKWAGDKPETILSTYLHAMPDREERGILVDERRIGPEVEAIERVWELGEHEWAQLPSVGKMWGTRPAEGS